MRINSAEQQNAWQKKMAIIHERMADEAVLHRANAGDVRKIFQTPKASRTLNKIISAREDKRVIDDQVRGDQVIGTFVKPLLETVFRVLNISVPEAVKSIVHYFETLDTATIKKISVTKVIKDLKQQKQDDEARKERERREIIELHNRLRAIIKVPEDDSD